MKQNVLRELFGALSPILFTALFENLKFCYSAEDSKICILVHCG